MKLLLPLVCLVGSLVLSAQSEPAKSQTQSQAQPRSQSKPKSASKGSTKSASPADPEARPAKRYKLPESELVNINGASKSELMARLGLDAAMAEKVVKGRPYLSKADLVTKKIMSQAQWQGIRYNIIAKQPIAPKP